MEFPCEFPVKAMGRSTANIEDTVLSIVSKHVPDIAKHHIKTRASSNGRYIGITINITAHNREQIDAIYMDLTEHPDVLYVL